MVISQFNTGFIVYNSIIPFTLGDSNMSTPKFNKEKILTLLGANIQIVRKKQNVTLTQLSSKAHYDRFCLKQLESGNQNIKLNTAKKLAQALDIPFTMLFSIDVDSLLLQLNNNHSGYIDDDYISIFVTNFKRSSQDKRIPQFKILIETTTPEATVSRIVRGKNKNPEITTLYALAFTIRKDMSILFTRIN